MKSLISLTSGLVCLGLVACNSPPPSITLPWGTWQADRYEQDGEFYVFSNVRFGKAPTGILRFNASVYPDPIHDSHDLQDSSFGPICHQISTERCDCPPYTCPNDEQPESPFLATAVGLESEDCLFLDLYVPSIAFERNVSLPVVVWFYGGSFLFGAKDSPGGGLQLYRGDGILQAAAEFDSDVIYVVANYRLGMFGWLAGPTMEAQGVPNAGLHDQRLLLEWVQDFIHLVGGNKGRVSVWGESAGASSIIYHLIAHEGSRDPLFSKAVAMSPGFEWQWDRTANGKMEQLYKNLTAITGCDEKGVACLRSLDQDYLAAKSQELYNMNKCSGVASIGPAVDGRLIYQLPGVALSLGKHWNSLDSLIISHVADEARSFVPKYIKNEYDLDEWLHDFLPQENLSSVRHEIARRYGQGSYGEAKNRAAAILQDAFFICNTRQLYDAYNASEARYMMQYDFLQYFGLAVHGSDLLPLFYNKNVDITIYIRKQVSYLPDFVVNWLATFFVEFATQYQKYFVSHAVSDSPNPPHKNHKQTWKKAKGYDQLKNVMQTSFSLLGNYFNSRSVDNINTASTCNFWTEVALNISAITPAHERTYPNAQDRHVNLEL